MLASASPAARLSPSRPQDAAEAPLPGRIPSSWGGSSSSTTAAEKPTSRQAERGANRRMMELILECCQRWVKRDVTDKRQGSTKKPCESAGL
jgi:transposase InsO family protein